MDQVLRAREDLNLAKEAQANKPRGNKCFVLWLFPPHMCMDVQGGDSRPLSSAGAAGAE